MNKYETYKKDTLCKLSAEIRKNGQNIQPGQWQGRIGESYKHILPLKREAKGKVLQDYFGVTFIPRKNSKQKEPLHPYIHHLNSSQLLCYMVFSKMLNANQTPTESLIQLFEKLKISISQNAECSFEYRDGWRWNEENEPEGTSFDFHIIDKGNGHEYFFEIKFTEKEFSRSPKDNRHEKKIKEVYLPKFKNAKPSIDEFRKYYQLFRNILRADANNKTVIFITDVNNPAISNNLKNFINVIGKYPDFKVKCITWQEICKNWPQGVEKPFQFVCF